MQLDELRMALLGVGATGRGAIDASEMEFMGESGRGESPLRSLVQSAVLHGKGVLTDKEGNATIKLLRGALLLRAEGDMDFPSAIFKPMGRLIDVRKG